MYNEEKDNTARYAMIAGAWAFGRYIRMVEEEEKKNAPPPPPKPVKPPVKWSDMLRDMSKVLVPLFALCIILEILI